MSADLDTLMSEMDRLGARAGRRGLELAIHERLTPLSRWEFATTASFLLEAAATLAENGREELAEDIAASVVRTTRSWAQRNGALGAYSEGLAQRAREFARFLGTH